MSCFDILKDGTHSELVGYYKRAAPSGSGQLFRWMMSGFSVQRFAQGAAYSTLRPFGTLIDPGTTMAI